MDRLACPSRMLLTNKHHEDLHELALARVICHDLFGWDRLPPDRRFALKSLYKSIGKHGGDGSTYAITYPLPNLRAANLFGKLRLGAGWRTVFGEARLFWWARKP